MQLRFELFEIFENASGDIRWQPEGLDRDRDVRKGSVTRPRKSVRNFSLAPLLKACRLSNISSWSCATRQRKPDAAWTLRRPQPRSYTRALPPLSIAAL